jgi:hypothetical protein
MPETHFDDWIAERYEILWPELFDCAVVGPTGDFLARLAGTGPALEAQGGHVNLTTGPNGTTVTLTLPLDPV